MLFLVTADAGFITSQYRAARSGKHVQDTSSRGLYERIKRVVRMVERSLLSRRVSFLACDPVFKHPSSIISMY